MKHKLSAIIAFFIIAFSYAQATLPAFTLNVKVTDETCLGNGTLAITVAGTVQGSTVSYQTYKLPDISVPISTSPTISGLSQGTYRVIATQTLGNEFSTQQKDVEILNKVISLQYNITSDATSGCGLTSTIIVNVTQGNPEFYEITMGPKTFPKQASNSFPGLPAGQYRVRVFDICGEALVRDYTLAVPQSELFIGGTISPETLTSCNSLVVTNVLTPTSGTSIAYPLHVVYTIHPPNGDPDETVVKEIPSGPPDLLNLTIALDLYGNPDFTYDIKVTDGCNRDFSLNNNIVGTFPKLILQEGVGKCDGKFLSASISNFYPTYSINFTKSPAGFDPKVFNSSHPGPFSSLTIDYGNVLKPVPFGVYEMEITDSCGRSVKAEIELKEAPTKPSTLAMNAGCDSEFGNVQIRMPDLGKISSVKITKAPPNYGSALPSDVSSSIDSQGVFYIENLPVGNYEFAIVDECNRQNTVLIEVPVFVKQGLAAQSLPNCTVGSASVTVGSGNGILKSIQITKAPANFGKELPFDVSLNLFGGQLFMSDLPTGDYEFRGIDYCDYDLILPISLIGYDRSESGFSMQRNCGSFNLIMADSSNGVYNQAYWLQKFNPSTNTWMHPFSGTEYKEGNIPESSNSMPVNNNTTTYNLTTTGNFRVIKTFQTFANAANPSMYKTCIEILGEFEFKDQLEIVGVYSLDCPGGVGPMSVVVDALGVPPYSYKITEKDGDTSFVIDNGNNNVFSGLAPATYNFQVQDFCEGLANGKYTVGSLPKLVEANSPSSMLLCGDGTVESSTFDLTQQDAAILGNQNPNNYKVTYYLSSSDAESGTNPIANPNFFLNTTNPQTIYARVMNVNVNLCYATTSFQIFLGTTPVLVSVPAAILCEGDSIVLNADPGYDAYEWSTGETTASIQVSEPGVYNVKVKNVYADVSCDAAKDLVVKGSGPANFEKIEINDLSENANSIKITVSGSGDYEYSLDNVNFQAENFFTDLVGGSYTVYVRDKNGCGTVSENVIVLSYPKFFTPDGDGINDRWQIDSSVLEPGLKVYVFDRFGKLITYLNSVSSGWDGTYNGQMMPSTDYWFMIERSDGRVYKGHFAMKR